MRAAVRDASRAQPQRALLRFAGRLWRGKRVCLRGRLAEGFTLVELLIALSLIGVITLLLFSGLRLGSRSWEAVETVSERVADVRIAHQIVRRLLSQARDISVVFDGRQRPIFAGQSDALEWAAPMSAHVGIPGLYLMRLTLEDGGQYPRLVLTRWLLNANVLEGTNEVPAWQPLDEAFGGGGDEGPLDQDFAAGAYGRTILLPEVQRFELEYFGQQAGDLATMDGDSRDWSDEWLEQREMPVQVRMALTSPRQDWPLSVIQLPGPVATNGTIR